MRSSYSALDFFSCRIYLARNETKQKEYDIKKRAIVSSLR